MASYTLRQTRSDSRNACCTAATAPTLPWSLILLLVSLVLTMAALDSLRWTTSALVLLLSLAFCVQMLEVFPSLGLQLASRTVYHLSLPFTSSMPVMFRSSRKTHLIPLERIDKVAINEGLQGAGGRHYLAVVKKGSGGAEEEERRVFVVFPSILPELADLQPVWKDAQRFLATK
ncbi:putative Phosphatidylinositol N-acetylglucosaminyltransferase [Rhodotorula toruloides]|nr:putative Phosphatidylinositol N-acetylglucosaminyltransferase [Rhodotorula toruloides]